MHQKKKKNDETTKAINAINPALVVCSCHFTFITLSTDPSDLFRSESCFRNEWFQIKTNTTVINYPTVEHNVIMFVFNILKKLQNAQICTILPRCILKSHLVTKKSFFFVVVLLTDFPYYAVAVNVLSFPDSFKASSK